MAGLFFCRALGVERDQTGQQRIRRARGSFPFALSLSKGRLQVSPAIGLQHGVVEFVVQRFEHTDQALLVDGFFFGGQNPIALSLSKGLQHVVQPRQREAFEFASRWAQHALAVRVDLLGQAGDAPAQCGREAGVCVGEGEGFEAAGFDVNRVIPHAQPTPRRQ